MSNIKVRETQSLPVEQLTAGGLLAKNTVWNLAGQLAPMAVALFAIPQLIHRLGAERFGVLTIVWVVAGYFSLFDLGIGRALTNLVAQKLGSGEKHDLAGIIWTGNLLMLALGTCGTIAAILISPWLVHSLLKISSALQSETLSSFYILSLAIPVVISTAGFRGVLEAYQRFELVNAIRIPLGVFTFLGPLMVLPFSTKLSPIVTALVAGRVMMWSVHIVLCLTTIPVLRHEFALRREYVRPLLAFGTWMTVSNIISPVMVYFDRFLIGGLLSMGAVAYYATPYEVATRLLVIPGALVAVLFPAFSTALVADPKRAGRLYLRGLKYVFLALFPITLLIVAFAHYGLQVWLGGEFADHSTRVFQWLAVGVLMNALAHVPFAFVQSAGRADITAKFHLLELPLYVVVLWWLTSHYGIEGAAIAWCGRVTLDCILLLWLASDFMPGTSRSVLKLCELVLASALALFIPALELSGSAKTLVVLAFLLGFCALSWFVVFADDERNAFRERFNAILF